MMYIKNIKNLFKAREELEKLKVHPYGVQIMSGKMIKQVFYIKEIDIKSANILKQECLGSGGDLALSKEASLLIGKTTDGIMMIDLNKLPRLIEKLKLQPFPYITEIANKIENLLERYYRDFWVIKNRSRELKIDKPLIMGILNITPDSFSDGGKYFDPKSAIKKAEEFIDDKADIIDIGGESTGPGSKNVPLNEEIERVIPVIERIRSKNKNIWLSIDTYKSETAEKALKAGADMINDVTALRGDKKMASIIAKYNCPVVLMYSKDSTPRTTRKFKKYSDVVAEIIEFLEERIVYALSQGIREDQIIIDPGMGAFISSDKKYSLEIIQRLSEFKSLGFPILLGPSRKSIIGDVLNLPVNERKEGSLALLAASILNGANILRMHDVKESKRFAVMLNAINNY